MRPSERPPPGWTAGLPKRRDEATTALWAEHERLRIAAGDAGATDTAWHREAVALLDRVRWALEDHAGDDHIVHAAWGWAMDVRRKLVNEMDAGQRNALAVALRAEAEDKLHGWRKQAILSLLEPPAGDDVDVMKLETALQLRDGSAQNTYRDALALRNRVVRLLLRTALAVIAICVMVAVVPLHEVGTEDPTAAPFIAAFGFLGGSISAFRPLSSRGKRYPEQLGAWYLTLARPFTGAAAALALYPLVLADFVPVEVESFATLAALSVAAGFSELPLSRAVAAATGRDD